MQRLILEKMKEKLLELAWVNTVDYEKIRLFESDFHEHELPLIQMYDQRERSKHVQGRTQVEWSVSVEVVMQSKETDIVDQGVLLDRKFEVKKKIGENVRLDLGQEPATTGRFIHMAYRGSLTDLHLIPPMFMARLDFDALYEEPYTGIC